MIIPRSGGAFSGDPMEAIARHAELHGVAASLGGDPDAPYDVARLVAYISGIGTMTNRCVERG